MRKLCGGLPFLRCHGGVRSAPVVERFLTGKRLCAGASVQSSNDLRLALKQILRKEGPMPVSALGKHLDDDTMERLSDEGKGLAEFIARSTHDPPSFEMARVGNGVNVVFVAEYFHGIRENDRELAKWLAARFVAAQFFPRAGHLPSVQPTAKELASIVVDRAPDSLARQFRRCSDRTAALLGWINQYSHMFMLIGGRVTLGGACTKEESMHRIEASLGSAPLVGRSPTVRGVLSDSARAGGRELRTSPVLSLQEFVVREVPSTFFVPLSVVLARSPSSHHATGASASAVKSQWESELQSGTVMMQTFGPSLSQTFVRCLRAEEPGAVDECPDVQLFARYGALAVGERVVSDLRHRCQTDTDTRAALTSGLRMKELEHHISVDTWEALKQHFSTPDDGDITCEVNPLSFILVFDRLRHVFDVQLSRGTVRLWSLLPPDEQPSSLTEETSPLPLLLRFATASLRVETRSLEALYACIPLALQRHLLAAYSSSEWLKKDAAALAAEEAVTRGVRCLRGFVKQHSLYFSLRTDSSSVEMVSSPQFLAAAAGQRRSMPRRSRSYSDAERADALRAVLPQQQAVSWTHFKNTPVVRDLPFDVINIRQDFFQRHFAFFRTYAGFASNALIVGRADGPPPPPHVLQPTFRNMEAIIKYLALHAVGGTTEALVMQSLSKEDRQFMKLVGTLFSVAEQLPEWFEVRKDKYNTSNTLITYIGPGIPTERDDLQYHRASLPLRMIRNDESCYLPQPSATRHDTAEGAEEDYSKWNPEWDES